MARRDPNSSLVFHRNGIPIRRWHTTWRTACQAAGVPTRFLHDCRRRHPHPVATWRADAAEHGHAPERGWPGAGETRGRDLVYAPLQARHACGHAAGRSRRRPFGRPAGVPTRFLHDCRRTAARNLIRASVAERVAMLLTGHKSRAIFDRYNIINKQELLEAGDQLVAYLAQQAQAPRGRSHAAGAAAPRTAPPLRLVRRTTA